jgi:hypothetical protein
MCLLAAGGGQRLLLAQETEVTPGAAELLAGAGLKIGVVDFDVVRGGWGVVDELQKQRDFVQQEWPLAVQAQYRYRQTLLFLTEDEADEALQLWTKRQKRAATEDELKVLEDLETEAEDRARKFQELANKEPLTEEEKRQLNLLQGVRKDRLAQLAQFEQAYQREIGNLEQQLEATDRRALIELRKAAQRVGEQLELDLVFTRDALLYGGTDISQDVIGDLEANVPALADVVGAATQPLTTEPGTDEREAP